MIFAARNTDMRLRVAPMRRCNSLSDLLKYCDGLADDIDARLQGCVGFASRNSIGRKLSHDVCFARSLRLTPPDYYRAIHSECGPVLDLNSLCDLQHSFCDIIRLAQARGLWFKSETSLSGSSSADPLAPGLANAAPRVIYGSI